MSMDLGFYKLWYEEDVKPHLTNEQKETILKKISKISLKNPLYVPELYFEKSTIPELAPFTKLEKFSGRQLMVVMQEIFEQMKGGEKNDNQGIVG